MNTAKALVQKNINRARYSLPFINPTIRELISLIPALFCEGSPVAGIHGHTSCTRQEYELLKKYLARKPEIVVGRLPDKVLIESLILLLRPSPTNKFSCSITLICRPKSDAFVDEIMEKIECIRLVFHNYGISLTGIIQNGILPQLLIYEIMRTGIVLAGMHPVTQETESVEPLNYIGELPPFITDISRVQYSEWNPFQYLLERVVDRFVENSEYPASLSVPGVNPYIIPYLHILHKHDEEMDADIVKKIRASLNYLYTPFPPTKEAMDDLKKAWKMADPLHCSDDLNFVNALQLRKWLVPLEENELPIFSWPPPGHFALPSAQLCLEEDQWYIRQAKQFSHPYPWVVLMWAVIAGLISNETHLSVPGSLNFKRDKKQRLLKALKNDVDIFVPEDHTQGSIHKKGGRFFFSDQPFAILEKGEKFSLELFESIKKKALLDDSDLCKFKNRSNKGN
jgi:hypothetical protein